MAYQGIKTTTDKISPTRRLPPTDKPLPHLNKDLDSDHFPDSYVVQKLESRHNLTRPSLDAGIERLIELAATEIGCPHEELLSLKDTALRDPETIIEFCQFIFDTRIRPLREVKDSFFDFEEPNSCVMRIQGEHGSIIVRTPWDNFWAPYHKATLEIYHHDRTPFD